MRGWYLFVLLFVVACAPEQSAEQRRREDVDRARERLSYAVGHYGGYLLNSPTEFTPMAIEISVKSNPTTTGDKPLLSVSLRIGLFGGVTLASTSSSFDWGVGDLVATFSKTTGSSSGSTGGGNPGIGGPSGPGSGPGGVGGGSGGLGNGSGGNLPGFELHGTIVNGELRNGKLIGSHLGTKDIFLKKGDSGLFDTNVDHIYNVDWKSPEGKPDMMATLKVETKPATLIAPGTSDLAYLPGLEGTLAFESFGSAPQDARVTYYDPTTATLDFQFSDHSWIHTSGVALSMETRQEIPPHGNLSYGGDVLRELSLQPLDSDRPISSFPPKTYLGTYQGSPQSLAYKAVAYIKFLGKTLLNTNELPFLRFPEMRLELDICTGNEVMSQAVFKLSELDYLGHEAVFHRMTGEQDPLEFSFSNQWSTLNGTLLQVDPHSGGKQPVVVLTPNAEVGQKGCDVVLK